MKVLIGGKVYNADTQPVCLIFEDDAERLQVAEQIIQMPEKEGIRMYCMFPDQLPIEHIDQFMMMNLTDDELAAKLKLMEDTILGTIVYDFENRTERYIGFIDNPETNGANATGGEERQEPGQ
jgi:hypothetical protein